MDPCLWRLPTRLRASKQWMAAALALRQFVVPLARIVALARCSRARTLMVIQIARLQRQRLPRKSRLRQWLTVIRIARLQKQWPLR